MGQILKSIFFIESSLFRPWNLPSISRILFLNYVWNSQKRYTKNDVTSFLYLHTYLMLENIKIQVIILISCVCIVRSPRSLAYM